MSAKGILRNMHNKCADKLNKLNNEETTLKQFDCWNCFVLFEMWSKYYYEELGYGK